MRSEDESNKVSAHLRPAKHHAVEKNAQLLESYFSRTGQSMFLDRSKDFVVPEARLK